MVRELGILAKCLFSFRRKTTMGTMTSARRMDAESHTKKDVIQDETPTAGYSMEPHSLVCLYIKFKTITSPA